MAENNQEKAIEIFISPFDSGEKYKGQTINFINILSGDEGLGAKPQKRKYSDRGDNSVLLLNYENYENDEREEEINFMHGWAPMGKSKGSETGIFKQEIGYDENNNVIEYTKLEPVTTSLEDTVIRDFNIANGRTYRYRYYPGGETDDKLQYNDAIPSSTNWQNWSITELHPVDTTYKKFTATANDVWLFNLNVSTGEQTQNIVRNEQQTLGQYKSYAQGKSNYISGSVSCLMGTDVYPASYVIKNGRTINQGGYREVKSTIPNPTSNERIDMLLAWRKVVYSPNPKLLKDRAGQSFLVVLNSSSNTPMDNVRRQPNTINFTWTQIGTTEGLEIVDNNVT